MDYKRPPTIKTTRHAATPTSSETDHIRVAGYIRVSTDMQVAEGVSLEAQSEKIKAYCKLHGVLLIGIFKDEGLSAKSLERPGLKSALTKLEQGKANALLVVKLDRLTRSLLDLDTLIRGYFPRTAITSSRSTNHWTRAPRWEGLSCTSWDSSRSGNGNRSARGHGKH